MRNAEGIEEPTGSETGGDMLGQLLYLQRARRFPRTVNSLPSDSQTFPAYAGGFYARLKSTSTTTTSMYPVKALLGLLLFGLTVQPLRPAQH
jgi:hypothetical protein